MQGFAGCIAVCAPFGKGFAATRLWLALPPATGNAFRGHHEALKKPPTTLYCCMSYHTMLLYLILYSTTSYHILFYSIVFFVLSHIML